MGDMTFVVTGTGMHTPVGTSTAQTCAALRAGISRVEICAHFSAAGEPVLAGVLAADRRDLPWVEKAVPIAEPAIREALWQAGLYAYTWHRSRVGLFLATPPPDRTGVEPEALADFRAYLGDLWTELAGNDVLREFSHAQVGGAVALAQACEALARGEVDAAVVAGCESALDGAHLGELLRTGRLHTAENPHGLIPGEGAAALVLETEAAARRRDARALARLVALALEQEPTGWTPKRPSQAAALTRALQTALAVDPGAAAIHRVIVDHTGERWRFREWTLAEPRALGTLPRGWSLWHPVDGVGDLGPAFVPFAIGWATQAFARRYAGPGSILVAAMSDTGERAAVTLMPG
jgi:3-oxoacyl-[acyl-carrier-protein] synthase-1